MNRTKLIARLVATGALGLTLLAANSGVALAQSGSVGRHSDNGAQCFFSQIQVNAPQVYAFDATSAIDTQTVMWTSEIWRLDEATGEFVFDSTFGSWTETVVEDGTGSDYIMIGGGQTYDVHKPGTYRAAIRYFWVETANASSGEAYEWVGEHYLTDWSWIFSYMAPSDSCVFA